MDIKQKSPYWYGDLNEDCCAKWSNLLLRAERMYEKGGEAYWWWAVSSIETSEELYSSNSHSHLPNSGEDARKCAETTARQYFESMYLSLFRHVT